jgi:Tol biopolymer transport system component
VWLYDLSGVGAPRRLTFAGRNRFPVWSPDSRRLAFQSDRGGDAAIFVQNADGTGEAERLTRADADAIHMPDGSHPAVDGDPADSPAIEEGQVTPVRGEREVEKRLSAGYLTCVASNRSRGRRKSRPSLEA